MKRLETYRQRREERLRFEHQQRLLHSAKQGRAKRLVDRVGLLIAADGEVRAYAKSAAAPHREDIKAAIRKQGVTPADIADSLGCSRSLVSRVIAGTSRSKVISAAIAKVTGIPLHKLWPDWYASSEGQDPAQPAKARRAA
jgi:lambda repressor-like predicted transcriptional regulator